MPKKNKAKAVKRQSRDDEQLPPKQSRVEAAASPLCFDSPVSLFESLIQPMGAEQFFQEYWEKKPLHLQRSDSITASYYQSLFQLCDLQSLCSQGLQFYRDVNVVRCVNGRKKVFNKDGQLKSSVLKKFLAENKATIQFHQPQRFKDELWRIQEKLECFFGALVGSNIYITPQESQGLPAHYDDVESPLHASGDFPALHIKCDTFYVTTVRVFVLQLEGEKRWLLYKPTVPLAGEYSLESEERIGSPTHDIILKAGDVLYFPRGTIHQASTPAGVDHSTHLTLSTYQRMSWGDLLLDIFPSMLYDSSRTDISLRQGMPRRHLLGSGEGQDTSKHLATCLRSLADEMESGNLEVRSTHMQRDFIMNRLPPYSQQELTPSGRIPTLEDKVCLRFKDHMVVTVESSQERTDEATELVVFVLHSLKNQRKSHMMGGISDENEEQDISAGLKFHLSHLPALRQLQRAEQQAVAELQLPTQEAKLSLVLALWSESLLDVV